MTSSITGKIFDIKKYAIHDGPGIRTTVFLKDCPMSCWWCHNPEGLQKVPKVIYDHHRCIGCHDCEKACPADAISVSSAGLVTDNRLCTACGLCVDRCSAEARKMSEQILTVSQLMAIIHEDILFYDESGGGVTFSGGEPLLQPDFLIEALSACGRSDIHRVIDTSGYASRTDLAQVASHTDLFLYDLKCIDSKTHRQYTGVPNNVILDNLVLLHDLGVEIIVRIPLIPGFNDDVESISQIRRFLLPLENIHEIHILPYHEYQKNKYCKLDIPYLADHFTPPTQAYVFNALKAFEQDGYQVKLGG
jgi:pyruvate formate lyase activating enzyme